MDWQLVFMGGSLVVGIGGLALSFAAIRKSDWVRIEESRRADQLRNEERMSKIEASQAAQAEKMARDYVRHETLQTVETRIVGAIDRLTERLDLLIDRRPAKST
jgi:hypothetical protein